MAQFRALQYKENSLMIMISCSRIQQLDLQTCFQNQSRRLTRISKRELKILVRQIALLLGQACLVLLVLQAWEVLVHKLLCVLMAPPTWVLDPAETSLKSIVKSVNLQKIRESLAIS